MTDTPPDWVLLEAAKRCGWTYADTSELQFYYDKDQPYASLCDMILKHEQPPVDRKLLCAREAYMHWSMDERFDVEKACARAIELWEEGFGK